VQHPFRGDVSPLLPIAKHGPLLTLPVTAQQPHPKARTSPLTVPESPHTPTLPAHGSAGGIGIG
jgi:hypothetical protein